MRCDKATSTKTLNKCNYHAHMYSLLYTDRIQHICTVFCDLGMMQVSWISLKPDEILRSRPIRLMQIHLYRHRVALIANLLNYCFCITSVNIMYWFQNKLLSLCVQWKTVCLLSNIKNVSDYVLQQMIYLGSSTFVTFLKFFLKLGDYFNVKYMS